MVAVALPFAVEMPVELWVNGVKTVTFMCTPCDLEELAIGHLLTRGMLKDISAIDRIMVEQDTFQIFVSTSEPVSEELYSVPEFVLSGTTSVSEFNDNIYRIPKVESNYTVNLERIISMMRILDEEAPIYQSSGGVHGAILYTDKKYYLKEDIGRHCAIDKAIGAACKDGADLSNSFICTTGRVSLDMLLKAASVRIPVIASLKYPSDMGIKLAQHYQIAIVSGALSPSPIIYAYEQRVKTSGHSLQDLLVSLSH